MISFICPTLTSTVLGTGNTRADKTDVASAAVEFMLSKRQIPAAKNPAILLKARRGDGAQAVVSPELNLKGQKGNLVGGGRIQREAQEEWLRGGLCPETITGATFLPESLISPCQTSSLQGQGYLAPESAS